MALNRKTFKKAAGAVTPDALVPSENFNTILYEGTGAAQKIGGYINKGAAFDGTAGITTDLNIGNTSDFSISFWVRNITDSNFGTYDAKAVFVLYNNDYIPINYSKSENKITFPVHDGTSQLGIIKTSTLTDDWTHIVFTQDVNVETKVYVNGSIISSETISHTSMTGRRQVSAGSGLNIGVNPANTSNDLRIKGKLDQVRIFDKALSSGEVTTLYGETHASTTIATTDIFNDDSGVALYQLDGNALDTGGVSGKFDSSAAIFNGSSSYIRATGLGITGNDSFSVSTWINTTDDGMFIFLGNGDSTSPHTSILSKVFYMSVAAGGGIIVGEFGFDLYTSTTTVDDGNWHHIAFTSDGTTSKLYIDGTESNSTANTFNIGTDMLELGRGTVDYYYQGKLDEVRIYSDALTAAEVGYLYNNTTASIPTDNLEAYYKLDGTAQDEQQQYDGVSSNIKYAYDGTASNIVYQEATAFTPDLIWVKARTNSGYWHTIFDSVRGPLKRIFTNATNAETTTANTLTSFDSNGFSLGSQVGQNANNEPFVAWCFKGGGAAVSDTSGSITSQVSANTEAGFSIVSYTGNGNTARQSYGHGLNSAPELVINKGRITLTQGTDHWIVGGTILGNGGYMFLSLTNAKATSSSYNGGLVPDNDVVYISNSSDLVHNQNNATFVSYCFHSIDNYQKVGSYTGTGAAGNFVETGFEPAFIMIKRTDAAGSWVMLDNKRITSNPRTKYLTANTSDSEGDAASVDVDFLTNGFSVSGTNSDINTGTYIYLAIASDPDETTPVVEDSFDVVTYTGTGTTHSVEADFKPDLVWIKTRSTSNGHLLYDSIRGATNFLSPNSTGAQAALTNYFDSFDSNGFTLGTSSNHVSWNKTGDDYVAWLWKAGDHDDNLPEINDNGTIDSTVSVNDAAGFSIVKYTGNGTQGADFGHGLSTAPEMVIFKRLETPVNHWFVYHKDLTAGHYITLDQSNAEADFALFNDDVPDSTTFPLSNNAGVNGNGIGYIAYCWKSVTGYSKIGSYSGTGSAGNAQNVGFAPRFVMAKRTDSASGWIMETTLTTGELFAHTSDAENSLDRFQLNSTGFEFTGSAFNESGSSWIYMAFK